MKLVFLPSAAQDFVRLREFIEPKNPKAAARVAERLYAAAEELLLTPELGRPIEGTTFRKLVIRMKRTAYVMRYRVWPEGDAIVIVRIWHGRERQD